MQKLNKLTNSKKKNVHFVYVRRTGDIHWNGEKIDVWLFSFKIKSNAERISGQKGESAMSFGILI